MRQNEYKIIAKKQTTSGDNQIAGIPNPYFRYYFVWLGYGPSQANVDEVLVSAETSVRSMLGEWRGFRKPRKQTKSRYHVEEGIIENGKSWKTFK